MRADPPALLTGRNHHSVGMGSITETATSAPGQSSLRPNTKAPLAMTLKLNGYSTAHSASATRCRRGRPPMGLFDPGRRVAAFEYFYGFIGENNKYDPALYDGHDPGPTGTTPDQGYHLTEDLADLRHRLGATSKKRSMPDKPFFIYFAPAPPTHRTTAAEWSDKYAGRFAAGGTRARADLRAAKAARGRTRRR